MRVIVITMIPSPYQVELFDRLAVDDRIALQVVYRTHRDEGREWASPSLCHQASFVDVPTWSRERSRERMAKADLVVLGDYQSVTMRRLMRTRQENRRPWCFWGERPGFRYSGFLGRWYRRFMLWPLYRSQTPIWGIGRWAIEGYKREFGSQRPYFNIPYFSNLERFAGASRSPPYGDPQCRRFLYSGTLSKRKGVDVLARAFRRVARSQPNITLDVVGNGPLRESVERVLDPVADRVTFHGFQQWEEMPAFYAAADVLCAPSRYDGWGLIVPEGLAAGLPVIATRRMGAAIDLIKPEENGWRIAEDSVSALAQVIENVATMPRSSLKHLQDSARASVADHTLNNGVDRFVRAAQQTTEQYNRVR